MSTNNAVLVQLCLCEWLFHLWKNVSVTFRSLMMTTKNKDSIISILTEVRSLSLSNYWCRFLWWKKEMLPGTLKHILSRKYNIFTLTEALQTLHLEVLPI